MSLCHRAYFIPFYLCKISYLLKIFMWRFKSCGCFFFLKFLHIKSIKRLFLLCTTHKGTYFNVINFCYTYILSLYHIIFWYGLVFAYLHTFLIILKTCIFSFFPDGFYPMDRFTFPLSMRAPTKGFINVWCLLMALVPWYQGQQGWKLQVS